MLLLTAACGPRLGKGYVIIEKTSRTPSPAIVALAARELACDPERVTIFESPPMLQASGCLKVVYFERKSEKELARVGSEYVLEPENDPHQAVLRAQPGTRLMFPVKLTGEEPKLTGEQVRQLHTWSPRAKAICVLGVDGRLRACLVLATEPVVGDAVARSLPGRLYRPAAADGTAVPVPYVVNVNVVVPVTNCHGLTTMLLRSQCERAENQGNGPADAPDEMKL